MQTGAACGVCSLPVAPHVQISFETFWAEMLEGIWSWDEETVLEVKRSRDAGGSLWLPDCPQKFLSLPGGSFFSCHSVPPLPPCCSVPSSRSLVPRNQRTAGKIPTMWLEVWGVFGGDVLGSVPLPTRTSTPLPLCVCFAKGPHCTTAFSLLRGGLMAKSALLLPARAGRSRQGRRTVLAAGSFHADGCLTQPGNEMSRTGRAGRSLGIRSELVPLQLALSPSERSLVTCIPSGRPQGCPQHFGIMQMPGLLPPPSQLKQLVSPSAARASSWGNGGTKRGVLVPRAGHHYWGEAEIQKPSAKPQEQQAPSPGPLPWPI
ncbi:uncharacterized protein ACIBXB_009190 isoform 5-T6 [Morphnus guianensis]